MISLDLRDESGHVIARSLISNRDSRLATFTWYLHSKGYVVRNGSKGNVYLHREIMGLSYGDPTEVDHENGNTLDNRRYNLRVCTRGQNAQNQKIRSDNISGYRGVSWHKYKRRWRARCTIGGRVHLLGYFSDVHEAGRVVSEFRREHMPFSKEASAHLAQYYDVKGGV